MIYRSNRIFFLFLVFTAIGYYTDQDTNGLLEWSLRNNKEVINFSGSYQRRPHCNLQVRRSSKSSSNGRERKCSEGSLFSCPVFNTYLRPVSGHCTAVRYCTKEWQLPSCHLDCHTDVFYHQNKCTWVNQHAKTVC